MSSFLESVRAKGSVAIFSQFGARLGSTPSPFDAVEGHRLVGPSGSHPLALIGMDELVRRASKGLDGQITINEPVRIGEAISGSIALTALRDIAARGAMLRLVGALITEEKRSREERNSEGRVVRSEQWVEVTGRHFEELPFVQPALPPTLAAGQTFAVDFTLPAPRLGPVSAHMGSAILAWALDAKWDISMGGDERLSALVNVRQNLDYLRSGAVRLEPGAMFDAWQVGDASIAVSPLPPIASGSEIDVTVAWPSAGSGRGGRLELQADVEAPNGLNDLVLWSVPVDPAAFRGGVTMRVPIPADAPPTLNDKGVAINYRLRAIVDRQFRSDLAVERALAVM